MPIQIETLAGRTSRDLLRRNAVFSNFFRAEAARLAAASQEMSRRFLAGGRLLAFGQGAATTDAQHVAVEFVHPVIVGKRALPALDLGPDFEARLPVLIQPDDMVMGFAFPQVDPAVERSIGIARERGALTFALTGEGADYSFALPDDDPFVSQEIFEVLYHLLWETVHVYFEHREQGHDVGASSFLYPFLGKTEQPLERVLAEVQQSMLQKTDEINSIRAAVAEQQSAPLADLADAICQRIRLGGKIILFGNGGSATDANDLAVDLVAPPAGFAPVAALSLSTEAATITAVANDIGSEAIFSRQLIAHLRPQDVAIGISTSGSSPNVLAALAEARKRGLLTIGVAGYDGGKVVAEQLADHAVVIPSDYIPRIQEVQASVYHVLRCRIEELMTGVEPDA
jgi:D-sedoheptulose 7-phosphate isomerase